MEVEGTKSMAIEHRYSPRTDVWLPGTVEQRGRAAPALAINLSRDGVYLCLDEVRLPVGATIGLRFVHPDTGGRLCHVRGLVVRTDTGGAGIMFSQFRTGNAACLLKAGRAAA